MRDADLLAELGQHAGCTVCMSVPTVDEDAWGALEPGTAHPLQRLRAVRQLRDAGVNAGVLMAPVVPGFTHAAGEARGDDQGDRRSRRRVHGRERDVSEGRHQGPLPGLPRRGVPGRCWKATSGCIAGAYAPPAYVDTFGRARMVSRVCRTRYDVGRADRDDAERVSRGSPRQTAEKAAAEAGGASHGEQRSFECGAQAVAASALKRAAAVRR